MVGINSMGHTGRTANGKDYPMSNAKKYSRLEEKQNKMKTAQRSRTIP